MVNKLEVELRRLERSQEDADQETRRLSLAARSKDAEITTLKSRVEDLASEGARLNETLGKQRQLKDKLEEQLAASEARVEGLLQEIDAMDAASAQASMHVSNAMASASEAHQRSLQEMRAKQAEAEAYIESLDSRLGALEEERNALRRELDRAYAREKDARVRLQETEKRSNELTGEINALLEQDARRNSVREHALLEHVARTPPRVSSRFARANGASTSTKKLHVHEVSDDESDGEEFVVIRRRSATAPNSPFMVADSPRRAARQFNGLNSVNSALARARAPNSSRHARNATERCERWKNFRREGDLFVYASLYVVHEMTSIVVVAHEKILHEPLSADVEPRRSVARDGAQIRLVLARKVPNFVQSRTSAVSQQQPGLAFDQKLPHVVPAHAPLQRLQRVPRPALKILVVRALRQQARLDGDHVRDVALVATSARSSTSRATMRRASSDSASSRSSVSADSDVSAAMRSTPTRDAREAVDARRAVADSPPRRARRETAG